MHRLVFSKFIPLTSVYLGFLIKKFLETLFLMIRRSPVTTYLWCISSAKGKLLYSHSRLSGFVKNKPKPRLWRNLLKLKNLM